MAEVISEINLQSESLDVCSTPAPSKTTKEYSDDGDKDSAASNSEQIPNEIKQDLWFVNVNKNNRKRASVVSETPSMGWLNVKKRLGTLAAVQTVIDSTKKTRVKKPVEQRDFLEKFSTREYNHNPVRGNKRSSSAFLMPGKKFSSAVNIANHNASAEEKLIDGNNTTNNNDSIEMNNLHGTTQKPVDTVVTGGFSELEIEEEKDNVFKRLLYAAVEPYGNFLYYWLFIVITVIHYNAWILFLRIAFEKAQTEFQITWFVLDYLADFVYVMDLIIHMRMSFLKDGIYVDSLCKLALAYVKSYQFALDLVSIIPLDFLYFATGVQPSWRLLRLLKYYKVFTCQKTILSLTNYPNIIRTFFFLHLMLVMMHWNACFYFMVSKWEGFGINQWVYPKLTAQNGQLVHQYAMCYYWSTLSLTTIGGSYHPETTIECAYMIVCYAVGIFIFATIVGQAGNVIQNMNANRIDFEKQRDSTMQYMKRHNVPEDVQRRVRLWYDYSYSRGRFQGDTDINDIVLLPNKMKTELALHVHLETLRRVTFLQKCQPEFLHDLVLKMKLIIFTPGDYICRKGEVAREMYVISNGILEVLSETGRILKVLNSGDFFGEIGILSLSKGQNKRTADVRAYGYVELFVLSKDDVLGAIKEYPDTQKILARYGRNRLKKDTIAQGGPRDDTTSDSEDEQEVNTAGSGFLNLNNNANGGFAGNLYDRALHSIEAKRGSIQRRGSMRRRESDTRRGSILKHHVTSLDEESKSPRPPNKPLINDMFSGNQKSSVIQNAMMSIVSPAIQPATSEATAAAVASIKSPPKLEKRDSRISILVNSDTVEAAEKTTAEEEKEGSVTTPRKSRKCKSIDTEELIEMMQLNQEEILNNMKTLFKKKMFKNQKKLLERIQDLEELNNEKEDEIRNLKEQIFLLNQQQRSNRLEDNNKSFNAEDSNTSQNEAPDSSLVKRKSKSISPKKRVEKLNFPARSRSTSSVRANAE
eukprot:gene13966-15423_t